MIDTLPEHPRWSFITADSAEIFAPGCAYIEESTPGGEGRIDFPDERTLLCLKPINDNHPIRWFANNDCADGAFIVSDGEFVHVHLVELKSTLNAAKWTKSRLQFEGMLANVLALVGFLETGKVTTITCHLALKRNTMITSSIASPVLNKRLLGQAASTTNSRLGASQQFEQRRVSLLDHDQVTVKLIQRDVNGNGSGILQ